MLSQRQGNCADLSTAPMTGNSHNGALQVRAKPVATTATRTKQPISQRWRWITGQSNKMPNAANSSAAIPI